MDKKNDGGPAFPFVEGLAGYEHNKHGMTLRDYFAGQALAGLMTSWADQGCTTEELNEATARIVYDVSDAMLAERDRGE